MDSPILSATGRTSCPGFILVETQFASDVHSLSIIENIYPKKATIMPPEVVLDCLGDQMSIWTPQTPGWVRLLTFPYRGDLAFISNVDPRTLNATLIVVPRIDYTHPEDRKLTRFRKRPPQALFNAPAVRACFGEGQVEKRNHIFLFETKVFLADGFLETESSEIAIIPENTTPTEEELYWFYRSSAVPAPWLDTVFDLIKRHALQLGNRVKVLSGDHRGAIATIMDILDNEIVQLEVSISLLTPKVIFKLHISEVRKYFSIGDEVIVTAGPHKETTGWVIAVESSNVQVFDHKTSQHVCCHHMHVYLSRTNTNVR